MYTLAPKLRCSEQAPVKGEGVGWSPTGVAKIMGYTGEKKREYARQWMAKRRADYFKDKSCVQCGSRENLELDHIDPSTKLTHCIWSWRLERRLEELSKCQVLCCDCHTDKSSKYFKELYTISDSSLWKHGTNNTYNRKGCRCELCCQWRKDKFQRLKT